MRSKSLISTFNCSLLQQIFPIYYLTSVKYSTPSAELLFFFFLLSKRGEKNNIRTSVGFNLNSDLSLQCQSVYSPPAPALQTQTLGLHQVVQDVRLLDDILCHGIGFHVWVQTSQVKLMFFVSTVAAFSSAVFPTRLGVRCLENPSSAVVEDGWWWRGRCQGVG